MLPRIAVDLLGGDLGRSVVVEGALRAVSEGVAKITLVGPASSTDLAGCEARAGDLGWLEASEQVLPGEAPAAAVMKKPAASINVACRAHAQRQVDAVVTLGHSGAAVVSSHRHLRPLRGVRRAALMSTVPGANGAVCLLDVGAVVEPSAQDLLANGRLGLAYWRSARLSDLSFEVRTGGQPRVALLSNGAEATKGTSLVREAHSLLEAGLPEYVGMIEGHRVLSGDADVVVCDGFVGNILLKGMEGVLEHVLKVVLRGVSQGEGWEAGGGAWEALRPLLFQERGGALLLGVDGVVVVAHGRSDATAVFHAIQLAAQWVQDDLLTKLKGHLSLRINSSS